MKKIYFVALFFLLVFVSACSKPEIQKNYQNKNSIENSYDEQEFIDNTNEINGDEQELKDNTQIDQHIVIGGYRTNYTLSRHVNSNWFTDYFITIGDNMSVDLSGIEQFHNSERLYISLLDTNLIDFSPLKSLPVLEFVEIGGKGLTKIPNLGGIPTLTILELRNGRLINLNGIEKITTLEHLLIADNYEPITDLSAIRYLVKLKTLKIYRGFYTVDLYTLANLPELEELSFSGSEKINLAGISLLKYIKKLHLVSNIAKDIDVRSVYKNIEEIGKMTGLKELYLDETITSVEFLADSVSLESLELVADMERDDYGNVLLPLDVKPLSNLVNLKYLAIRGFELENADALEKLPELKYFSTRLYDGDRP